MNLTQNYSAVVPGVGFVQFVAINGTEPYTYQVVPGGAGGSIDVDSGSYMAPPVMTAYPATKLYDTIIATDAMSVTATARILIATPLFLVMDIIQNQLGLANDHCFIWNQKVFQPTDSDLYVIGTIQSCTPFGNVNATSISDGSQVKQFVAMYAKLDLDIISRGPAARDQKEFVVMALNSIYSQQQQEANGFYIAKLPVSSGFLNLSQIDGAAIPYRYKISYAIQYQTSLIQSVPFYDTFEAPEIYTSP